MTEPDQPTGVILRNAQAGATCGSPAETHAIEKSMSDTKMADQGRVKPALAVHSAKPFIERIKFKQGFKPFRFRHCDFQT